MYICPTERPERMFRRGRPEVEYFSPDEMLFRRYRAQDWLSGGLSPLGFKFPGQSVNRASMGEPEDVLFSERGEFNGWGVLEFRTDDLPSSLDLPNVEVVKFFMTHVPLEDNYTHSEIHSATVSDRDEKRELPSSVKKLFRAKLGQRMKVRIAASI